MYKEADAKIALDRVCEAYGFTTKAQLADYLGVTAGSLSNRVNRNAFPAEIVVRCAYETNASIKWLVTGEGLVFNQLESEIERIPSFRLDSGDFINTGTMIYDKAMLPNVTGSLAVISDEQTRYFIDLGNQLCGDGKYLIEYSGAASIKDLMLLPGNKIRIAHGQYPIDTNLDDIVIKGRVVRLCMDVK